MRKPNILLITSDQQHYDTLGFANPLIKTPALDRLAREGTNHTRAYCPNPTCTPTRASILSGQYPSVHGAWSIGVKTPENTLTVGELLAKEGYDTTLVGKAHFQPLKSTPEEESVECQPTVRDLDFWRNFEQTYCPWYGFDHVETARNHAHEAHVGGHYAVWMEDQGFKDWKSHYLRPGHEREDAPNFPNGPWSLPEQYHYTPWTAQRTIAHIERCHEEDKPFFMWSSFHDPHPPYLVPEPWASMYDPKDMPIGKLDPAEVEFMCPFVKETLKEKPNFSDFMDQGGYGNHGLSSHLHDDEQLRKNMAIYYGMTSFMDHHIGKILDKLDDLGIADNTIVVFTTDHGHFLGQHGLVAKAFMYEDNVRIPFITRWPGHIPAGRTDAALQSLVDLAPSFLEAAGVEIPGRMQGVSQLPVWTGEAEKARDSVFVEHRHQKKNFNIRTFINERYKLTIYKDRAYGELFDLQEDPGEFHNRWDDPDYQTIKAKLFEAYIQAEIAREPTLMPRVMHA